MAEPKKPHGGARPGAGRPRSPAVLIATAPATNPLHFLLAVMNDASTDAMVNDSWIPFDAKLRIEAAKAALPFTHTKPGEVGKKEAQQAEAKKAAVGRYAPSPPPGLRAVK